MANERALNPINCTGGTRANRDKALYLHLLDAVLASRRRSRNLYFNPNKVYSREELLNLVWGYEYPGDVRTVDVHIRRLREKIERNPSEPKYVFTKWGVGYYYKA